MKKKEKSLLNIIKEAIITHSPKDVQVHQHTFAAELIGASKKCLPLSPYDFLPRSYRGKKMILTRHIVFILRTIVLFAIAFIYCVYDVTHLIIKGEPKSHRLKEEEHQLIYENIKEQLPKKLKYENGFYNHFQNEKICTLPPHPRRWRGMQPLSGLNSIIAGIILIGSVIIIIFALHFLIKEVILPDNNSHINSCGVVSIDQGCLEEHHFFLLNAANSWTQTGITINKGDKVYITASGSMYSDVDDYTDAAKSNNKPSYPRSNFSTPYNSNDPTTRYCIFGRYKDDRNDKENLPQYGSLLYQICSETQPSQQYNTSEKPEAINQINSLKYSRKQHCIRNWFKEETFHFEAETSGLLQFCFNDILLDTAMIDTISIYKQSSMRESLIRMCPDNTLESLAKSVGIEQKKAKNIRDSLFLAKPYKLAIPVVLNWLKDNVDPYIWFHDNLGEALVNIRVVRSISNTDLSCPKKIFMHAHRLINWLYHNTPKSCWYDFAHSNLLMLLLLALMWFLFDIILSNLLIK